MTITIDLPPATVDKLREQAAAAGEDVATFIRAAVEAKLTLAGRSHLSAVSEPLSQADLLAQLQARSFVPPPGTPDSVELLREDRSR